METELKATINRSSRDRGSTTYQQAVHHIVTKAKLKLAECRQAIEQAYRNAHAFRMICDHQGEQRWTKAAENLEAEAALWSARIEEGLSATG